MVTTLVKAKPYKGQDSTSSASRAVPHFLDGDVAPLPPFAQSLHPLLTYKSELNSLLAPLPAGLKRGQKASQGREESLVRKPRPEAPSSAVAFASLSSPLPSRSLRCAKQPVKVLTGNVSPLLQLQCNMAPSTEMRYKECTYSPSVKPAGLNITEACWLQEA